MQTIDRLSGTRIDASRLDYELARRGLNQSAFASLCGLTQSQLSAIRRGRPITPRTLRKIADALLRTSPVPGFDLVLAEPEMKKTAGVTQAPAVKGAGDATADLAPSV